MDIEDSINYSYHLQKIIFDSFSYYDQVKNLPQIKKIYGNQINNIDIMIKIGLYIFFIHCKYDDNNINNKLESFNCECNTIKNKYNNNNLIFHKICVSKIPIYHNNIINIHNSEVTQMDMLLHKLYYYIADTTNIYNGLKSIDSDDVIMTIRYK